MSQIRVIRMLVYEGEEEAVLEVLRQSWVKPGAPREYSEILVREKERYQDLTFLTGTPIRLQDIK